MNLKKIFFYFLKEIRWSTSFINFDNLLESKSAEPTINSFIEYL